MSEIIVAKTCTKCKTSKAIDAFPRDNGNATGYHSHCKKCKYSYEQSEAGKLTTRRYLTSNKGRVSIRKRRTQPNNIESRKRYLHSEKGQAMSNKIQARRSLQHPEQRLARVKVNTAVHIGRLPRITTLFCFCSKPAQNYHHYLGYATEHHFDIVPLCISCHKDVHIPKLNP